MPGETIIFPSNKDRIYTLTNLPEEAANLPATEKPKLIDMLNSFGSLSEASQEAIHLVLSNEKTLSGYYNPSNYPEEVDTAPNTEKNPVLDTLNSIGSLSESSQKIICHILGKKLEEK